MGVFTCIVLNEKTVNCQMAQTFKSMWVEISETFIVGELMNEYPDGRNYDGFFKI